MNLDLDFQEQIALCYLIILVFIAIFTLLGNTLVLIATWRERGLHQPNKYFIAFLAVADLLVGVLLIPLKLYQRNLDHESLSTMSLHLCRFLVWIDTFAFTISIYTLTFISFDRYLKISKPLQYKSRMTTSRSVKIIFLILIISTFIATYAVTLHSGGIGHLVNGVGPCKLRTKVLNEMKGLFTFLSIGGFFLPSIIIMIMYVLIFLVAHKRKKMFLNGELGQINNQNQRGSFRQDLKVIKMLLVVVGVFICCWGPWAIVMLVMFYYGNVLGVGHGYYITFFVISILPLLNSMCNPIIYACLDKTYRESFKRLFHRIVR
ncbi:alpha-2B adrenergic receptor-like [Dendronephthya gigantea]|uniref:alpha-2B adrenergic receptor-like n=1 Tax=Dendronephthya gigantea TaxID=151771 RepID=UPI00106A9D17|nr:alpha-2B adrenergic receptor-like [Dendronephthya gigantea]